MSSKNPGKLPGFYFKGTVFSDLRKLSAGGGNLPQPKLRIHVAGNAANAMIYTATAAIFLNQGLELIPPSGSLQDCLMPPAPPPYSP